MGSKRSLLGEWFLEWKISVSSKVEMGKEEDLVRATHHHTSPTALLCTDISFGDELVLVLLKKSQSVKVPGTQLRRAAVVHFDVEKGVLIVLVSAWLEIMLNISELISHKLPETH